MQAQIAAKQQLHIAEQMRAAAEAEAAAREEATLQQKLVDILSNTQPQTDFRRKKVDWWN